MGIARIEIGKYLCSIELYPTAQISYRTEYLMKEPNAQTLAHSSSTDLVVAHNDSAYGENMEIKEFVKTALTQIKEATKEVSDEDDVYYLDVDSSKGVHFDLAVITTEEQKDGMGAKVAIAGLVQLGGETGSAVSAQATSRIQFNVKHRDLANERSIQTQYDTVNKEIL